MIHLPSQGHWNVGKQPLVGNNNYRSSACHKPSVNLPNQDQQLQQILSLLLPLLVQLLNQHKMGDNPDTNSILGNPIADDQDGLALNFTQGRPTNFDIPESDAEALGVELVPGYDYYLIDNGDGVYSSGDRILAAFLNESGEDNGALLSKPVAEIE